LPPTLAMKPRRKIPNSIRSRRQRERSVSSTPQSLVLSHWSLVTGHWSLAIGHWPLVTGHWPPGTSLSSAFSILSSPSLMVSRLVA
jgi:hypothetical protein